MRQVEFRTCRCVLKPTMIEQIIILKILIQGLGIWTAAIQAGSAGFGLTSTGHQNTASNTFQIPALLTTTPTQWLLLDSDADGANYTTPEDATLTSGVIDLSTSVGEFVALEFEQFFAEWDNQYVAAAGSQDHCYLGVSINGTTWTEVEINDKVGREARANPEVVSWDITDEISGNESTVYLRFRWSGAWNYGWQIDNVEINTNEQKDLTIVDTWRTYSTTAGIQYSQIPLAHVEALTIGAIIRNVGHDDQTNVTFNYEIFNPSMTSVATGTAATTLSLSNMEQDTILETTTYVPDVLGTYTIVWSPTSTEGDDDLSNDTITDAHLEITQSTYASDYNEGAVVPIVSWPLLTGISFFGNLVDFQVDDKIGSLDVAIANNASNVGEIVTIGVYRFVSGGAAWDILVEEYNAYTLTASDIGSIVNIPMPAGGLDVTAGGDLYMFTVGYLATPTNPMYEKQGDIGWNNIQGRDETAANRGFFDRLAPIVRPVLNDGVGIEDINNDDIFMVYPNPAIEAINVYLSLNQSANTVINVLDISGKVIKTVALGDINGDNTISISLDEMSTGVYFVEMVNDAGKQVKKFVKK